MVMMKRENKNDKFKGRKGEYEENDMYSQEIVKQIKKRRVTNKRQREKEIQRDTKRNRARETSGKRERRELMGGEVSK